MELTGSNLTKNSSGGDVVQLHKDLIAYGYSIADEELSQNLFGDTTREAVIDLQKKFKLPPTGIVDAKTAWLMEPGNSDHEHPVKFIVMGRVIDVDGSPLEQKTVKGFDKDLRSEQEFEKTDKTKPHTGEYEVFYHAGEFSRLEKDRADLIVRVFDGATVLASSPIIFNAGKTEVVDFTIGAVSTLSEFETIVHDITPLIDGIVPPHQLTAADIAFLSGEMAVNEELLILFRESALRNIEANTIAQSVFYGLFRQNLPTVLTDLLQNEISLLRAALESSSAERIIAQLSPEQLDQIVQKLEELKASLILKPGAPGEISSLGDLLKTSQLSLARQQTVAELQVKHGGSTDAFWQAINASDFTPDEKKDVRFTLQVGQLTFNHIPLVKELRPAVLPPNDPLSTTNLSEDATALRPYAVKDVAEWKTLLQKPRQPVTNPPVPIGTPPNISGDTLDEKMNNYAATLNKYMENVLPTPVIAGRADKDIAADNPFLPVKSDLKIFFGKNPAYEFRKTPIDVYLSEDRDKKLEGVVNPVALVAELKNMQRLFNIMPRYAEMRSLRKDNLHSAVSMVKVGERRFVEKYSTALGGSTKAVEAYRKAKQTQAAALNIYLRNILSSNSPGPFVIPNGNMKSAVAKLTTAAGPDLSTLFGSLDLCDCEHCQSVYSPAAYFVDIMKFLADGPMKGDKTPLDILLGRRPDLQHIELTCENTSTEVPYVDLMRELLEAEVKTRVFQIPEGSDISTVLATLDAENVPNSFRTAFTTNGYSLTDKVSVRKEEFLEFQPRTWLILDSGWSFNVTYKGTGRGFDIGAWPQTSWTADELRAAPEHVHDPAYTALRDAVYPWTLPMNLPVEESRVYLGHFGVKRHEVMETFFRTDPSTILNDPGIANEYLGVTNEEGKIITGVTTGGGGVSNRPWDFWGLIQTGNDITDPTDGTSVKGDWDVVLQRVSIFLFKSGLAYRELLEVLGSYFINPAVTGGRTLGIVSTDSSKPDTCNLSKLEIRVLDSQITDKKAALIAVWKRIHRFVRLSRRLGWTMRDLDKAIVALQPKDATNTLDITADFLLKLSQIQRLRAQTGLPVVSLLSFWAPMDAGKYLDHFSEGDPAVPSLYATLFNNKTASAQLPEDPNALTGKLSDNAALISAALQITVDELSLLIADTTIVPNDTLTHANLSALYRHATLAKTFRYSIRTYLSLLKLIPQPLIPKPEDTVKFTQQNERIVTSGFSVEDLNYLLRHDFLPGTPIAITDDSIALALNSLRKELGKIAADNNFVEVSDATNPPTSDPKGDLTKRKLAQLNWDAAVIEQMVAVLNETFTHETTLNALPITLPEDLAGKVSYDSNAKQLRFTGVMTVAEKGKLLEPSDPNNHQEYRTAVQVLFDAPRKLVKRHMQRFSVPRFKVSLPVLPNLTFPDALKNKIYYDTIVKELNFIGVMTATEQKILSALSSDPTYRTAIESLFKKPDEATNAPAPSDAFITDSDIAALFDTVPTIAPPARFIIVLRKLLPYLRDTLSERIVIQRIGENLQLDSKAASGLLKQWVNSPTHAGQKAIKEFLAIAFVESNPNEDLNKTKYVDQFKTFLLLYKIAVINHKFDLTPQQLQWLFDFVPTNAWLDLNKLPLEATDPRASYDSWARLADLFKLRNALPNAEALLTDVFTSAHAGTQINPLLQKISTGLSWKLENLQALNTAFSFGANSYKDEAALIRLRAAFTMLEQFGSSADQCLSWTKGGMTPQDETRSAQEVKSIVRAKFDSDQWLEKAKALNDPLREMQRAALVSFLLLPRKARDGSELYDDFLMDVEMSPSMMTTRIKQAISSVQLFVQRTLMKLEIDVDMSPEESKQWNEWRKQYRMWEANRKILLYPENWIEPELRDDKSPFYKELENDLLQNEVTMDAAETAFVNYLEKLQDVARLEIVGVHKQVETGSVNPPKPATNLLHVIGRTFSAPHNYYYRTQVDGAYWTPWEKIEADIQGNHLIPVVWNRRLYLFWPIFNIKQQETTVTMPAEGAPMSAGQRILEIQIAWTEYRNGKWSSKKAATPFVSKLKHPDIAFDDRNDFKLFSFKSRIQRTPENDQQLFIDCYGPVENVSPASSGPATEQLLFRLGRNGFKTVSASVNGTVFQSSAADVVEIVGKTDSGQTVSVSKFSAAGSVDITNSSGGTLNYYLKSAVYRGENIELKDGRQVCTTLPPGASPKLVGSNGGPPAPALVGTTGEVTPLLLGQGITVCEIIGDASCEFDLVSINAADGSANPITSISPMQAIASFYFDDSRQNLTALRSSNGISTLEPMFGTRFENMMLVEYENSSDDGLGNSRILRKTPNKWGKFCLLGMSQSYIEKALLPPFFFQNNLHTYFLYAPPRAPKVRFDTFYHGVVSSFSRELNRFGVSGLLTLENQLLTDKPDDKLPSQFAEYDPDAAKVELGGPTFTLAPREDVDFSYTGSYSSYNWELFFHVPFMIATQLSKNQRFDEAQKWFHYIFNPTATDSPQNAGAPGPERFWRVKPFYDEAMRGTPTLEDLLEDTNAFPEQVNQWMANPFKPHVIARLRLVTYMKAVVMRYVDNLIAWGDQLFRRDTIESINEATQLYILAAQILGRRPEQIPPRARPKVQTFRSLDDKRGLNSLANTIVEIEGFISPSVMPPPLLSEGEGGVPTMNFFGIPANDKLLGYWDTVADRLFKIRHSLNINGVGRSLPVFEPPIDPGLLVRAANAGVDIASALSEINVGLPHYRFNIVSQKAMELCSEVKVLGGELLSALEKRDAEALALLRSTHEVKVVNAVRTIKEKQLDEAKETRAGLERSLELTTERRNFYRDIAFMNDHERLAEGLTIASGIFQAIQATAHAYAGSCHLWPETSVGPLPHVTWGGSNIGQSTSEFGAAAGMIGTGLSTRASMAATTAGYERRFDEWKLQERLADKELLQIQRQIAAADLRTAIAEKELRNHELEVENTKEIDEFMRSKFTNRELYDWMVGQISGIYFQSYQLAYDVAKRAERAYRYELGLKDSNFIQFGYWDSLKKGLLAGERLAYDLRRMEVEYMDQNKREYEIVKHVSLQSIDPVSLVKLKQTGECFVSLPEALFDVDYPGHYMRRIKSVGLTVPCVTGPYSGVNCTLTLQSSSIRHSNTLSTNKYGRQADDLRFTDSAGSVQSIVTSGAQQDSGLFETSLHDERYLPFEGQGAISSWRIELPKNFKTFDYNSISDVVLHVRYTSREGGSVLKTQAELELQAALNEFIRVEGKRGLAQMFSLRHDFPTEWSRFLTTPSGSINSLTATITNERFPFLFQGKAITIKAIELYTKVKPGFGDHNVQTMKIGLAAGTSAPGPGDMLPLVTWNDLLRGTKEIISAPGAFTLNAWRTVPSENPPQTHPLDPNAIQDIMVVCRYTLV